MKYEEALKEKSSFSNAVKLITEVMTILNRHSEIPAVLFPEFHKQANEFMDYQHIEKMVHRTAEQDRVFPLETVAIQSFRTKHNAEVENAVIHTGFTADEYTRAAHALAITVGTDIYFRNGAYKPETEEGRKLLAHELTHVQQHTEHRIDKTVTTKQLETEAEQAEVKEVYDPDPFKTVAIDGTKFTFRQSQWNKLAQQVAENVEQWVKGQKQELSEEEYLKLLCRYDEWLKDYA
jgi:hypothetical protein